MKILHLLASPVFSGPAEGVHALALAQRELGHEVAVAIDRKRLQTTSEEPSLPYFEASGLLDGHGLELSVKSSVLAMIADARKLGRVEADVVHCHFSHDHAVAALGRPKGSRLVRSIHAPRSLRWSMPPADALTLPMPQLGSKAGKTPHLVMPALVAPGFAPSKDLLGLRKALGLEGAPVIGMVSTFQPSRRHDVGIDAFALLRRERPEARLVLVGDGQLEAVLRARVISLGLSNAVTFAGYQKGSDFIRWLQAFDEVWVLGLGNDFSARAAAQARTCGARVLGVDEGALGPLSDVVVKPEPEDVARASLRDGRRSVELPSREEIARRVLDLYAKAGRTR